MPSPASEDRHATGDNEATAKLAEYINVNEVHAGLLPADKVTIVESLLQKQNKNETLAFVGDGMNDAPVLSRADLGIAMGALGSDAAIEAADVVLMDDDPLKITKAVRIARKCMRIVKTNIWFAIGVKFACHPYGALGIANMDRHLRRRRHGALRAQRHPLSVREETLSGNLNVNGEISKHE